ncbi:MAG TPA: hypothetical protein VMV93_07955 [Chloroflexota bacterium]|nr:hypothetical protein [Chloroflexota bacterium]
MDLAALAGAVQAAVREQAGLNITVDALDGMLVLDGRVPSLHLWQLALAIAEQLAPTVPIDNDLLIEQPVDRAIASPSLAAPPLAPALHTPSNA